LSEATKVKSGDEAGKLFCHCNGQDSRMSSLCASIRTQCLHSFCRPVCLRLAWTARLEIDCAKAPHWDWCPLFAQQVKEAEDAVIAQFQGHFCLQNHFCNRTESFVDWIENHSFGSHYPRHRVPIPSCNVDRLLVQDHDQELAERLDIFGWGGIHSDKQADYDQKRQILTRVLCLACQQVVSVSVQRARCLPDNTDDNTLLQPASLQERCLFVAELVAARQQELTDELQQSVCSCLGCCGNGKCFFPNVEKEWLGNLVQSVRDQLTESLIVEGWRFPTFHDNDFSHTLEEDIKKL